MAPPVDPPSTITLRVKVPPGHIAGSADEFTLGTDIAVSLKIAQIRERIQEAIPTSPTPERQRLLYGGRALIDNDQTVADALNIRRDPTQNDYVLHLVVKGHGDATAPLPPRAGLGTPNRSGSPAAADGGGGGGGAAAAAAARPPDAPHLPPHPPHYHSQSPPQVLQQMQQEQAGHAAQPSSARVDADPVQQQHQQQHQAAMLARQQHQAAVFAQQQRLHAQMLQTATQRALHTGLVPFGFQPINFGAHGPSAAHGHAPHQHAVPVPNEGHNMRAPTRPRSDVAEAGTEPADDGSRGQPQPEEGVLPQQQRAQHQPPNETVFSVEGIGLNGQRITIHQQTVAFPNMQMAAQHMPFGGNMMPPQLPALGLPPLPGMPQGQPQRSSALDQARDNIVEMRRMLTELRGMAVEEHQGHIDRLQERTQAVNNYIDPLNLHGTVPPGGRTDSGPAGIVPTSFGQQPGWQQRARQMRNGQQAASRGQVDMDSNVTCYLLSSPSGPHALLYSPQHGTFTGQLPPHESFAASELQPTPTSTVAPAGPAQDQDNLPGQANAAAQAPAQDQAAAAAANPLGPMEPIMGHVWLLLRILLFSYFLLGTNMGWQRPLALLAIAGGFWMIRLGLLGDGGALRRWWEVIVQEGQQRAAAAQQPAADGQAQAGQHQNQDLAQPGQAARPAQMPTPAQVAQRLLDEQQRQRNANRDQRWQWLRNQVRPAERALALLVASLWPGVGEAYVRAREQEARRLAGEEVAARRREEEERQRKEEEEKAKPEDKEKPEVIPGPPTTADAASGQQQESSGGAVQVDSQE